jgi:hypoxanthine phosphoribosyltransferase
MPLDPLHYGLKPDLLSEILIDEATLQRRVSELGAQVSRDYAKVDKLLLVAVLKGSVVFLTDLMRCLSIPHAIDFMAVASYGVDARQSSGTVRIDMDLRQNIEGRTILIVEDIVDSGTTLSYILRLLRARNPADIKICALLSKPSRRQIDLTIDYVGFEIPDKFVFGYGLDLDEFYRNLPFIGVVNTHG